jgi:6-phosphogluconolactonase/glucosamine-6-phosphate isomerase/deaminase
VKDRRVLPDLESLSVAAAEMLADRIRTTVDQQGRCALVLTGGRTPRRMYELLAGRFGASVPWPQVDLFWGDERYVPPDDPQSNYHLAKVALLDHITIPPANVRPCTTGAPGSTSCCWGWRPMATSRRCSRDNRRCESETVGSWQQRSRPIPRADSP